MELTIKNTGRGFDRFGACEVCKKRCDNHYYQSGSPTGGGLFGHADCLKSGSWVDAKLIHEVK